MPCGPRWPCGPDHPRGCGEHSTDGMPMVQVGGSSPRMRGALDPYRSSPTQWGIIPADAGSTVPYETAMGYN